MCMYWFTFFFAPVQGVRTRPQWSAAVAAMTPGRRTRPILPARRRRTVPRGLYMYIYMYIYVYLCIRICKYTSVHLYLYI